MVLTKINPLSNKSYSRVRFARVTNQFDKVSVYIGSEEIICGETYMSTLVDNKRLVKFKKSALDFT